MESRPRIVTLICGASGAGKSRLAIPLAQRYRQTLGEADDVVTAVKALTTADQAPALHFWDTHPEAAAWPPQKIAELHFTVAEALRPGLAAVIADHLAFNAPAAVSVLVSTELARRAEAAGEALIPSRP